jgi:hypothetical protein
MTTKVVCRLLDADNQLMGWTEVQAVTRGDGKLWAQGPVAILAERPGLIACVSTHWCDVNVETRVPFVLEVVKPMMIPVYPAGAPLVTVGPMPGPLPAVTVRSVAVGIPVGQLGARG